MRKAEASDPEEVVDVAHALAPVQARDLDGEPVRLGTLWEDRPAVLLFLRHFG
jgi:hypothetical protein